MSNRLVPAQIRGARAMLGWSMMDLARASGLSISTVKRMEMVEPQPVSDGVHLTIQATLETAGVRFLDDRVGGIGMRLQPR